MTRAGVLPQDRHNVTVSRRELVSLAACAAAIALAACSADSSAPTVLSTSQRGSSPHAHASPRHGSLMYASSWAHLYRGSETFCLRPPLSGTAKYAVHAGIPSFALDIHGFPPKTGIGLDWINNLVRGYMVGAFTTHASGSYIGAARMFRLGEVRAITIKFERKDGTGLPGKGKPC